MKRVPSFSTRPGFPSGLRVLLLENDLKAKQEADLQLRECGYTVTCCSSSAEAAAFLSNPDNSFDVLLADVKILSQKTNENSSLVAASRTLPLILMSDSSSHTEVMLGIKLGAVDFLEKPLSLLKLRNIWQHTVRKMMQQKTSGRRRSPESDDSLTAESAGCQLFPEEAFFKSDCSSADFDDSCLQQLLNSPETVASDTSYNTTVLESCDDFMEERPQKRRSVDISDMPQTAVSPAPCVGFPAGQLPPLPNLPGVVWGLPTTPLQIQCKVPSMMPPMPFPVPPVPAVPPFSNMMFGSMGMLAPPMAGNMPTMPCPTSLPPPAVAPVVPPVPAAHTAASTCASTGMRRAESTPHSLYCSAGSATASGMRKCDSVNFFDVEEFREQQSLLGLHLKKSASLVDMITESLLACSGSAAS